MFSNVLTRGVAGLAIVLTVALAGCAPKNDAAAPEGNAAAPAANAAAEKPAQ